MRIVFESLTLQTDMALKDEQTGGHGLCRQSEAKGRGEEISSNRVA